AGAGGVGHGQVVTHCCRNYNCSVSVRLGSITGPSCDGSKIDKIATQRFATRLAFAHEAPAASTLPKDHAARALRREVTHPAGNGTSLDAAASLSTPAGDGQS